MSCAENCLEQVVHELLERALGGQQPRQVDLGDQLVAPLVVLLTVGVVAHQVPHFDA